MQSITFPLCVSEFLRHFCSVVSTVLSLVYKKRKGKAVVGLITLLLRNSVKGFRSVVYQKNRVFCTQIFEYFSFISGK